MNATRTPHALLALIIVVYVGIGGLYAALTPAWQVPDEPAHYNYIRSLAEGRGLPVIEPGDYDQAYLSRLTTEKFPPTLPVDSLEYGDHHPPLYYLLATPVYLLSDGALFPLRLLSVLCGAGLLITAFGAVRALSPAQPELALMTAALIAFIPQHTAMMAGVENDALAEFIAGGALWALLTYVQGKHSRPWGIGLLLGLALLTKTTIYAILLVAALAVALRRRREGRTLRWAAAQAAWMFGPALLLSTPWFIRNGLTYGWNDLTGLARHNAVVVGQPLSADWLAEYGWNGLLTRLLRTTFQSFWGQFGWMSTPMPPRFYQGLLLLSLTLAGGFAGWLFDRRRPRLTPAQRDGALLLLALGGLVLLEFLGYNLRFVQHQGRYLFPALIPLGAAAALGLSNLADLAPRPLRPWAMSVPFIGLALLDVYALFKFVIPFLAR